MHTRETQAARKRLMGYVDSNSLSKLEVHADKLEVSVKRSVPRLMKHNGQLAQMPEQFVAEMRESKNELDQNFTLVTDQVNQMYDDAH